MQRIFKIVIVLFILLTKDTLYSKPLPFALKPTYYPFGKWKESLVQPPIQKDEIKLRQSITPNGISLDTLSNH